MATELVEYEVIEGVAILTLNRPEQRNCINNAMARAMVEALDKFENDGSLHVAVLTGSGGNFCSGMDLKAFLQGEDVITPERGFAGITGRPPVKPIIAAVEGYALAGGFEIALACDLIVAASSARFGLPEVKRGLVAAAGGLLRLPRQLPPRIATELVLTGRMATATEMAQHGLINQVADEGAALDVAMLLAREIAANGPLAVRRSKEILAAGLDWAQDEMFDRQAPLVVEVLDSADAREGALAFAEKRSPEWRGV